MKKSVRTQAGFFNIRLVLALLLCCSGAFLALVAAPVSSRDKQGGGPVLIRAAGFSESMAVRDLPPVAPGSKSSRREEEEETEINPENRELIRHVDPKARRTSDAALSSKQTLQRPTGSPNAVTPRALPTPSVSFDGMSIADTVALGQGFLPPDTNGAVGPNQYVQNVNVTFRVWDKAGNPLTNTATIGSLFATLGTPCANTNDGDPVVFYDQLADRWIISEFCISVANPNNHEIIAVSKTGDATGAYYLYDFMMPNSDFNDYPHFGLWGDAYYMTDNQFQGNTYLNVGAFAFDRAKMLAGDPTASFIYFDTHVLFPPGSGINGPEGLSGMLPAFVDGFVAPPVGAPCPFVYFQANEFGDPGDQLRIFDFHTDFTTPANSTFTERVGSPLPVAAFDPVTVPDARNAVPQPPPATSSTYLDAIQDRIMFRLAYRNFGSSEALVLNHTVNAATNPAYRAGVRWYQLTRATPGSAFTVAEQQTLDGAAGDTDNRWMGSVAMNFQGDIALGYSVSSTSVFPSIRYAAKLGTDPAGSGLAQGEQTIVTGAGSQTSTTSRWGDYSDMTVDPSDDCTFWYTQEYYSASGGGNWRTRIAKFTPGTQAVSPRGTISGTITNCSSGQPLPNAVVTVSGGFTRTAAVNGTYSMTVAPGTYSATITAPGATPVTQNNIVVTNGNTATVNACLTGPPILLADAAPITADSCNANGVIDPNETVTVNFGIKNTGLVSTTNLVATLQTSGGVTNPSGPQTYGAIASGGGTAVKSFTFTAGGVTCGSVVTATLQLQDGATNLGTITYNFQVGIQTVALNESFDGVSAPALPPGWTATNVVGAAPLWTTSTTSPDTAPNVAFVPDPDTVSDKVLITPSINITSTAAQVTFRHSYDLENTFDGGVLEVSSPNINGGMFTDITNPGVGGSFVNGGYNSTIDSTDDTPLAGRPAWSGTLFGYATVTANLGPNVAGHAIKLRFRLGSDTGTSGGGWRIDGVKVFNGYQCCGLLMTAGGPAALTAEGFVPANGAPDPGEPVTVSLPLSNVGTMNSSNLVATLQATGGVTSPSAPQNYGAVVAAGPSVSRSFTFTAAGNCGDTITLTLALQDGATNLGTASFTMRLGTHNTLNGSEAFDGVSAPALPAGWTTAVSGVESAWVTSTTTPSNAPNDAFAPDATNVGNTELITPTIAMPAGGGQLTFRNLFNMEADPTNGYDGMVLEISINGGAFADITNGGNAFITGGYTRTIASLYSSPISGRPAWSGLSGGTTAAPTYITSTINLPAAAAGQNIKLKWRAATDNSGVAPGTAGVRIDDIKITGVANVCIGTQAPAITNGPPPSLAVVGTPYSFTFTATGNPAPTFSLKDGTLPPGINLSSVGVLSGNTSGGTGSYPNITVAATNGIMPDTSQTFSMTTATTSGSYLASFGLTGGNAAPLFDYDGDGIANLLEYALGLNPTINSVSGLPVVTLKDYSGTKYLSMTFNRSSLATDLTYNVQVSGDLGSWTTVGSSTGGGVTTGLGFVGEIGQIGAPPTFSVEVRDIVPFDPDVKRFIRLQVTTP